MHKQEHARMRTIHEKITIFEGDQCVIVLSTFNPPLICTRTLWDATVSEDVFDRVCRCRRANKVPYQYIPPWMWERLMQHGLHDRNTVTLPYAIEEALNTPDFDEQRVVYWDSAHDLVFPIGQDAPISLPVHVTIDDAHFDIDKAHEALDQSKWVLSRAVPLAHNDRILQSFVCQVPDALYKKIAATLRLLEPSNWRRLLRDIYVWSPAYDRFSQTHDFDFFGLRACYKELS